MMYYVRWLIYRRFRLAAELRHNAKKLLHHQRDLLTKEGSDDIQKHIDQLAQVMCSPYNRSDIDAAIEKLQQVGSHRLIAYKSPGIRENVEVCLFAVGIAMGIRTFFFQPMGIPTGSMQPTLYGITHAKMEQAEEIPGTVSGFFKKWLNGISYYQLKAEGNWKLHNIESQRPYLFLFTRQRLVFQDLDTGQLITKDVNPPLGSNGKSLLHKEHSWRNTTRLNNEYKNFTYPTGSDVFKVRRESGDHLLVNRFTYNFRKPKRGEIIVFETKNIPGMKNDKLFYIKRLVGLPNEKLDIKNRHVYINDNIIDSTVHPFEFIYSMDLNDQHPNDPDDLKPPAREHLHDEHPPEQNSRFSGHLGLGYHIQNVHIPSNQYYALGDNTVSSEDSRSWGTLPGKNIFGTPSFIYWPFFSQPDREVRPHRFGWAFQ